ncbi:MAG: hypothetical protein ACKON8_13240 [Planctomycetota bacterium]
MAKTRPTASPLDQVRSLLTSAERQVLQSSMGAAIAKATKEQVEAAMKRARALRDKWRDLQADQSRSTKRSPRAGSAANQRTRAKHDVFDGAVKRLEARLAEFAEGVRTVVNRQAQRFTAATKPSKTGRKRAARGNRASVRSDLKAAAAELNRGRKVVAKKVPAKAAAKPAAKVVTAAAAPQGAAAVVKPSLSKKRKKPVAPRAAVVQKGLAFDPAKQRSAKASAGVARLRFDGATTRRAGNALASTQRAQARRDGRRR